MQAYHMETVRCTDDKSIAHQLFRRGRAYYRHDFGCERDERVNS